MRPCRGTGQDTLFAKGPPLTDLHPEERPPVTNHRFEHITVPLKSRKAIGDGYQVLTFDAPGIKPAEPGHFMMIRGIDWGAAPALPRPMSYLNGGETPSVLVRICGEGTLLLGKAEAGDLFSVLGPLGTPWRDPDPQRHQILVAGGVGVAPLLFLARRLADLGTRPTFVYGARTDADLPLAEEIAGICELVITTEDGSRGFAGRVTNVLGSLLGDSSEVFTCGPEPMMAKVAEIARLAQIPCAASMETPMACGFGVCLGCPVPTVEGGYLYACKDGPCVDAHKVDWSKTQPPTGLAKLGNGDLE